MLLIGPRPGYASRRRSARRVARLERELSRLDAARRAAVEDRRLLEEPEGSREELRRTGPVARAEHVVSVARQREEAFELAAARCREELSAALASGAVQHA